MRKKTLFTKFILAVFTLMAAAQASHAQISVTISDTGTIAPPTPGAYDQYQTNLALVQSKPGGGNLNYYNNNTATPPGQVFTTGSNVGGYVMNTLSFQTGGASSAAYQAAQVNYFRIYALSGNNKYPQTSPTNATLVAYYQTQSYAITSYSNWLQVTGLNLPLAPNTVYAFTWANSGTGYLNLGNVATNPYTNGEVCLIPTAGGVNSVNYGSTACTNYDACFDIGLMLPAALTVAPPTSSAVNPITKGTTITLTSGTVVDNAGNGTYAYQWQTDGGSGGALTNIPGATSSTLSVNTANSPLGNAAYAVVVTDSVATTATSSTLAVQVVSKISGTLVDTGTGTAPSPGSYDQYQLLGGQIVAAGLNYYSWASTGSGNSPGETFTTGGNSQGYYLNSMALQFAGGTGGAGLAIATNYFDLFIYSVSGTTATLLADITNSVPVGITYGDWVKWTFPSIILQPNTVYAYAIKNKAGNSSGMSTSPGTSDAYVNGQICTIPAAGGTITYATSANEDGTFDAGLIPLGVNVIVNVPTATPNPAYALSPVKLTDSVALAGSATTYKWLTDDGTGANPPNYITISGATSTNLTVIPLDENPGGADYTTNYYFVATDTLGNSATSSVVTLTVHAASSPIFTATPALTNLVTFVGDNRTFSVAEAGTLPITNQWLFNNGGGFASLAGQTNIALTLSNLQTPASGTYQIGATNLLGNTNTSVVLTVVSAPAAPISSQTYVYAVYTNHPWAYWRLNETNDPTAAAAPTYTAYDYSGHGFDAIYGNAVTVSNAGPQPPTFPGFDANELAAGTTVSTPNSFLTPPALNLTGSTNVTFMAWINPNGAQSAGAGLLINRGGPDGACGFGFGNTQDHLGYIWNNNSAATYNWDSGLAVSDNNWNFVAYVITPTNTTIYLGNLNGGTTNFFQASTNLANIAETFNGGTIALGSDPKNVNNNFNGLLTEASLFTNALSSAQLQQYFLIGIGAQALAPTVATVTAYPASTVYSGQNVELGSSATGTAPLGLQWQVGDGTLWTNIPGANANSLLVNPFATGTVYYQLVATNKAGSATNGIMVTFNALPTTPPGLWTANFQVTNNIIGYALSSQGTGHYVGRGILGTGTNWNVLPCVATVLYGTQTISNATSFEDDGATPSGISCQIINGAAHSSSLAPLTDTSDVGNLLNQYMLVNYGPNALQIQNIPAGTYNVALYGIDGTFGDRGTTFVVHGSNGDQTAATTNSIPTSPLNQGVNFAVVTNVHVAAGTLNVDVNPTTPVPAHNPNTEADFNGFQLQLVSYDAPVAAFSGTPTSGAAPLTVTFINSSTGSITNSVWKFGDGNSVTNSSTAGVSHLYANPGTYTVTLVVTGPGGTSSATNTSYITVNAGVITPISITRGSMHINASGAATFAFTNAPNMSFSVRATNNLNAPVATWPVIGTPVESPAGTYNFTDPNKATNATLFYIISQP